MRHTTRMKRVICLHTTRLRVSVCVVDDIRKSGVSLWERKSIHYQQFCNQMFNVLLLIV